MGVYLYHYDHGLWDNFNHQKSKTQNEKLDLNDHPICPFTGCVNCMHAYLDISARQYNPVHKDFVIRFTKKRLNRKTVRYLRTGLERYNIKEML